MLTSILLLLLGTSTATAGADTTASNSSAVSANLSTIHWERIVGNRTVDSGDWTFERDGVSRQEVPSVDGSSLHMIAIRMPYPEGQTYPELDPKVHYFNGVNPDLGIIIIAEEHATGEKWLFQVGDRVITDDTGFFDGGTVLSFSYGLGAEPARDIQVTVRNGNWFYQECDGHPRFMVGAAGAQWEEVYHDWQGLDWQKLKGTKVPIPPELGQFYGFAHAVGEVWRVKINGKEYSAIATEAEPSAIEEPK